MVYTKAKRIYTAYKFYEKEAMNKKSSVIALSIMAFIFTAFILAHIILNLAQVIDIPQSFQQPENLETAEEYKNENIKNSRKILADYSDFIIYYSLPSAQKEEIKKEEKAKEIKVKKEITKAKPEQKIKKPALTAENINKQAGIGSSISNSAEMKNKAAAQIVYLMERYKKYPKQAKRINAEGIAKITFSVNGAGVVDSANITDTSGYAVLDKAALNAAEKIIGSKVINDSAYNSLLQVTVPVDFYLN